MLLSLRRRCIHSSTISQNLFFYRLSSSSSSSSFSGTLSRSPRRLRDYGFHPPPGLSFVDDSRDIPSHYRSPIPRDDCDYAPKRKLKLPYRPPSSLDRSGIKPIHSNLHFDFRFSYTESNSSVRPIGLRRPKYSPFGPGRLDREWTGVCAPAFERTVSSVDGEDAEAAAVQEEKNAKKARIQRKRIIGEPLTRSEQRVLVDKYLSRNNKRQVGRDGLTHNMLNDIHNNWKHSEAVRIKCMGVLTVDMENIYTQLEK